MEELAVADLGILLAGQEAYHQGLDHAIGGVLMVRVSTTQEQSQLLVQMELNIKNLYLSVPMDVRYGEKSVVGLLKNVASHSYYSDSKLLRRTEKDPD